MEQTNEVVPQEKAKGVVEGLKPLKVETLDVTIRGTSPFIVHAWSKKAKGEMLNAQQMTKEEKKKAKEKRAAKDPQADFEESKYIIDGKDSFPTIAVKKAMVDAGFALGVSRAVVRQALYIVGDYFVIEHTKCVMREDTVRVGPFTNRQADLRYRPEYQDWSAKLKFRYRTDMIDRLQLISLLQSAGFSVGLGEWRPQKDGQFGTFEVVE